MRGRAPRKTRHDWLGHTTISIAQPRTHIFDLKTVQDITEFGDIATQSMLRSIPLGVQRCLRVVSGMCYKRRLWGFDKRGYAACQPFRLFRPYVKHTRGVFGHAEKGQGQ